MRYFRYIVTCLLLSVLLNASAQDIVGLQGGINFSNIKRKPEVVDLLWSNGISVSAQYIHVIREHWRVGAEVMYQERGFSNIVNFTDFLGQPTNNGSLLQQKFQYLAANFFGGYTTRGKIGVYADLGFVPAILLGGKFIQHNFTINAKGRREYHGDITTDINPRATFFNTWDIAVCTRVGTYIRLYDKMKLTLGSGFQYSLTPYRTGPNSYHYLIPILVGAEFKI